MPAHSSLKFFLLGEWLGGRVEVNDGKFDFSQRKLFQILFLCNPYGWIGVAGKSNFNANPNVQPEPRLGLWLGCVKTNMDKIWVAFMSQRYWVQVEVDRVSQPYGQIVLCVWDLYFLSIGLGWQPHISGKLGGSALLLEDLINHRLQVIKI